MPLFSPVSESDTHYRLHATISIDRRLGTNADFAGCSQRLHAQASGSKRLAVQPCRPRLWLFQDVLAHREDSPYRDWFYLNFKAILRIMTGFGTKAGKATTIW